MSAPHERKVVSSGGASPSVVLTNCFRPVVHARIVLGIVNSRLPGRLHLEMTDRQSGSVVDHDRHRSAVAAVTVE